MRNRADKVMETSGFSIKKACLNMSTGTTCFKEKPKWKFAIHFNFSWFYLKFILLSPQSKIKKKNNQKKTSMNFVHQHRRGRSTAWERPCGLCRVPTSGSDTSHSYHTFCEVTQHQKCVSTVAHSCRQAGSCSKKDTIITDAISNCTCFQ